MIDKVLTPLQLEVLKHLFDSDFGERGFFLSGGTALAAFYLGHRYSDDLDFFARTRDPIRSDIEWAITQLGEMGLTIDQDTVSESFGRLFLSRLEGPDEHLKVDFVTDVETQMAAHTIEGALVIDSFEDIAVNKIAAITQRLTPEIKDHVDLYFILANSDLTVEYLLARAREKEAILDTGDGQLLFATNLLEVERWDRLTTRMIKPLSMSELRDTLSPIGRDLLRRLGTRDHPR